jgi:hypothetical protein
MFMTVSTRPAAIAENNAKRLVNTIEIVRNKIQLKGMAAVLKRP